MNRTQFFAIARTLFGGVLSPAGFTMNRSHKSTFYRRVSNDVYHFVLPDPLSRVAWYDVKVFPSSPVIDPLFDTRFPDALGIPTDHWSYLGSRGVGADQELFNCKYEDNMRRRFEKTVGPLLIDRAIPYLNQFQTIEEMIPWLKHPLSLGMALHHVGRVDEARPILQQERTRLMSIRDDSHELTAIIHRIDRLLGES